MKCVDCGVVIMRGPACHNCMMQLSGINVVANLRRGTIQEREGRFFALPYSAPAFSCINEYGPFDTLDDAKHALENAP